MKRILGFISLIVAILLMFLLSACSKPSLPSKDEIMNSAKQMGVEVGLYKYNIPAVIPISDLSITKTEKVENSNWEDYFVYCAVTYKDEYYQKDINLKILCRKFDDGWRILPQEVLSKTLTALKAPPNELIAEEIKKYDDHDLGKPSFSKSEQKATISGTGIDVNMFCNQKVKFIIECTFDTGGQKTPWYINCKTQGDIINEWKFDDLNGFSFKTDSGGGHVGSPKINVTFHKFNTTKQTVDMTYQPTDWAESVRVNVPYEVCNMNTSNPSIKIKPRGSAWSSLTIYDNSIDFGYYGRKKWVEIE